jgi:DNA-binding GntR family transcriptional regulator
VSGTGKAAAEHAIRMMISQGKFPPGYRLVERELAELLGVTIASVRSAIDALIAAGLAERIHNRGARVRAVTLDEAVAITEARMALEALIAGRAAERVTGDALDRLQAKLDAMRDVLADGDVLAYGELTTQLHELVHDMARQPVAAKLADQLRLQLVRYEFRLSLLPGRPEVGLRELTALVQAVADGDRDSAVAATNAHFRSVIAALQVVPLAATGGWCRVPSDDDGGRRELALLTDTISESHAQAAPAAGGVPRRPPRLRLRAARTT